MALNIIGYYYKYGKSGPYEIDVGKAVEFYKEAASKGILAAYNNIANCYFHGGINLKADLELAIKYYKLGAEQGCKFCLGNLGKMYYRGVYFKRNVEKALEYLKRASSLDSRSAKRELGNYYFDIKDFKNSILYFRQAAIRGDDYSYIKLGNIYDLKGNKKNSDKYYKIAYDSVKKRIKNKTRNIYDLYTFARLNYEGIGVKQNKNLGISYFKKCYLNYPMAAEYLGMIYNDSDPNKAIEYYKMAIDNNYFNPCDQLAKLYIKKGKFEDAVNILTLGEKNYDPESCFLLANAYLFGHYNLEHDYKNANRLFKKCAELNIIEAKYYVDFTNKLVNLNNDNKEMFKLFEKAKSKKIRDLVLLEYVKQDLINCFKNEWDSLQESTKIFLVTGLYNYINCKYISSSDKPNFDFSVCSNEFFKALENETALVFCKNYISFLKNNNISPKDFVCKNGKIIKGLVKYNQNKEIVFVDEDEYTHFTLGSIPYVFGFQEVLFDDFTKIEKDGLTNYIIVYKGDMKNNVVFFNKHFVDYCKTLNIGANCTEENIMLYLYEFIQNASPIIEARNNSSHKSIAPIDEVEQYGDWIIKDRKLLLDVITLFKECSV